MNEYEELEKAMRKSERRIWWSVVWVTLMTALVILTVSGALEVSGLLD